MTGADTELRLYPSDIRVRARGVCSGHPWDLLQRQTTHAVTAGPPRGATNASPEMLRSP